MRSAFEHIKQGLEEATAHAEGDECDVVMSGRNLGAEILDGISEIKQFKKGKLALRTHELD